MNCNVDVLKALQVLCERLQSNRQPLSDVTDVTSGSGGARLQSLYILQDLSGLAKKFLNRETCAIKETGKVG